MKSLLRHDTYNLNWIMVFVAQVAHILEAKELLSGEI